MPTQIFAERGRVRNFYSKPNQPPFTLPPKVGLDVAYDHWQDHWQDASLNLCNCELGIAEFNIKNIKAWGR